MPNVGKFELAAFAVFEPLFAYLIAAYLETPGLQGHAVEVLGGVNPDAALAVANFKTRLFDLVAALNRKLGTQGNGHIFKQMQAHQLLAQR